MSREFSWELNLTQIFHYQMQYKLLHFTGTTQQQEGPNLFN